jgi:ergothioneine biosynthesis protein EgtB
MAVAVQREARNEEFKRKLRSAWRRTDAIFALVAAEALSDAPIIWRHPFIFYVGHLPAFAWNQICGALLQWQSSNAYFDDLFCRGIDPDVDTGECHWHPGVPEVWPSLKDTLAYRDSVRAALLDAVDAVESAGLGDVMACNRRGFRMVLEHEFMHQETLLYMVQQLPLGKLRAPTPQPCYAFGTAPASRSIRVPAGRARLGAKFADLSFGWDNEFGEITVGVEGFSIDSLPVSNGEFFEFIDSGAYEQELYWRPEDWRWKSLQKKSHPTAWLKRGSDWYYRATLNIFPLEHVASWPAYVSLAEARAYARWRGKRLPTEAEFHRAAYCDPAGSQTEYPWGDSAPSVQHGNFDFSAWSPLPIGSRPAGASHWGILELVGNGWELTDTRFAPFPNFSPYVESYPDYSRDFFDGKHFVLKGASWATAADLIRPSFRNWYQAHYPYLFAKFRCVSS